MYYLNTDTSFILFQKTRKSEIYVDKSLFIQQISKKIGTGAPYICITRPRRFGKTVNLNMLGAYYAKNRDSSVLFDDLKIAGTEDYSVYKNRYNIVYIDFSRLPDGCDCYSAYIADIQNNLRTDLEETYPHLKSSDYSSLSKMFQAAKDSFIFLMDEWDSIFYEPFMGRKERMDYLKFLKGLLKDQPYVELAYMTGVLPIAKYTSGSELNMFDEYSFINDTIYDSFFGFSEEEVRTLCQTRKKLHYEELKEWYDGYQIGRGIRLFNPRSVIKALERGVCLNYWTETGPMNEIADCVERNVSAVRAEIVKLVAGEPVKIRLDGYSASDLRMETRNEILSAMVVYGFLSYYNGELRIPNRELMEKFENVLTRESMGQIKEIVDRSMDMLEATLFCDEDRVAEILEEAHDREIPFLNYNDENSLSCVITLCYLAARERYQIEREAKSGKGYCDYLFRPRKEGDPAIVLELKAGGTCRQALEQIKEKNYIQKVKDCRQILLVGINYDKEKRHQCKIERIDKFT